MTATTGKVSWLGLLLSAALLSVCIELVSHAVRRGPVLAVVAPTRRPRVVGKENRKKVLRDGLLREVGRELIAPRRPNNLRDVRVGMRATVVACRNARVL